MSKILLAFNEDKELNTLNEMMLNNIQNNVSDFTTQMAFGNITNTTFTKDIEKAIDFRKKQIIDFYKNDNKSEVNNE